MGKPDIEKHFSQKKDMICLMVNHYYKYKSIC